MKSTDSTSLMGFPASIDRYKIQSSARDEFIVRAAFARFDVVALAIAMGAVTAFGIWAATAVLLLKGAPPGLRVGPHLTLLANFLPGYSVSWSGSVVGLAYGLVIGAVIGILIAVVWNVVHYVYLALAVARRYSAGDL